MPNNCHEISLGSLIKEAQSCAYLEETWVLSTDVENGDNYVIFISSYDAIEDAEKYVTFLTVKNNRIADVLYDEYKDLIGSVVVKDSATWKKYIVASSTYI